jgi:hypothetical protein
VLALWPRGVFVGYIRPGRWLEQLLPRVIQQRGGRIFLLVILCGLCLAAVFGFVDVCRLLVMEVSLLSRSTYICQNAAVSCACFWNGFRLARSHLRFALYELLFNMYLGFFFFQLYGICLVKYG